MGENKLAGLATTKAELGYVHGVTSAIQTQLDLRVVGALVTTVGDPGNDTAIPTEQAVREAIAAEGLSGFVNPMISDLNADNHDLALVKLLTLHGEIDDENSGAADTIDWNMGAAHKSTLTNNVTLAFTGIINQSIGATATANGFNNPEVPNNAIDGDLGTHWEYIGEGPHWFKAQLPNAATVGIYALQAHASYGPKTWTLKGSNNGTNWSPALDTQTNTTILSDGGLHQFIIASPASYLYYRLDITLVYGAYAYIVEFQLLSGIFDPSAPCFLTLKLVQDGTGGRTVTWPATVKGTPNINAAANSTSIIYLYWDGANYYVVNEGGGGGGGGEGDVTGPEGATADHVALFDGATGKIIKDGGAALIAAGWLEVDVNGDLEPSTTFLLSNSLETDVNGDLEPVA